MINRQMNTQKLLTVPRDLVAEVEQFRVLSQMSSASEVWRLLLRKGLEAAREEHAIVKLAKEQRRQMAA